MTEKALRFTLKCEKAFIALIAQSNNREAAVWGPIVQAMIDDDPLLAVRLATIQEFPDRTIDSIRAAFGLTC